MSLKIDDDWKNQVHEYKQRMQEYFSLTSQRLRKLYEEGKSHSPEYREEYENYVIEMNKYNDFLQKFQIYEPQNEISENLAVSYMKYYRQMIAYFNSLLVSFPDTNFDETLQNPTEIMQEYIKNFSSGGQFNPDSWLAFMKMISRSNPVWFEHFMELSKSNGIDWQSIGNNYDFGTKKDESTIKQDLPIIFKDTIQNDLSTEETIEELFFCQDCEVNFESKAKLMHHYRGVMHMKTALKKVIKNDPEARSALLEGSEDGEVTLSCPSINEINRPDIIPASSHKSDRYFCQLCNLDCVSNQSLQFHLGGRRHQEKLNEKENQSQVNGPRLAYLISMSKNPLVGLKSIIEYIVAKDNSVRYECQLCNSFFNNGPNIIKHMEKARHRFHYINQNYPVAGEILKRDHSHFEYRALRISAFASCIEEIEGRSTDSLMIRNVASWSSSTLVAEKSSKAKLENEAECERLKNSWACLPASPDSFFGEESEINQSELNLDEKLVQFLEKLAKEDRLSYHRDKCSISKEKLVNLFKEEFMFCYNLEGIKSNESCQTIVTNPETSKIQKLVSILKSNSMKTILDELKLIQNKQDSNQTFLQNPMSFVAELKTKSMENSVSLENSLPATKTEGDIFDAYSLAFSKNITDGQKKSANQISNTRKIKNSQEPSKNRMTALSEMLGLNEPPPYKLSKNESEAEANMYNITPDLSWIGGTQPVLNQNDLLTFTSILGNSAFSCGLNSKQFHNSAVPPMSQPFSLNMKKNNSQKKAFPINMSNTHIAVQQANAKKDYDKLFSNIQP